MKLSDILIQVNSDPLSTHPMGSSIVAFINGTLKLSGTKQITAETTGLQTLTLIYGLNPAKQETLFAKEFTSMRQKDSYRNTVLILACMAVVVGMGYAMTLTGGEDKAGVFHLIIASLFELAKAYVPGATGVPGA